MVFYPTAHSPPYVLVAAVLHFIQVSLLCTSCLRGEHTPLCDYVLIVFDFNWDPSSSEVRPHLQTSDVCWCVP